MTIEQEILAGSVKRSAELISLIEQENPEGYKTLANLLPWTGGAHVIGVTGPAGAGKSTLINALVTRFSKEGAPIGIIAVDPSSPITDGSLLGDRFRMKEADNQENVFIRSMAQRSYPGGVCKGALGAICVMEAMGKKLVILESIGAGQADSELSYLVDTVITVFTPEFGDELQLMKAGLLEIGHIVLVNKKDKPGADDAVSALTAYAASGLRGNREVPVLSVRADKGEGLDELAQAIEEAHGTSCAVDRKRQRREKYRHFATNLLREKVWGLFLEKFSESSLTPVLEEIERGGLDPYSAVEQVAGEFERIIGVGKP